MLTLLAHAKINWTLDIVGRYPNGYHQMDMLMSSVTLADVLTIEAADKLTLQMIGECKKQFAGENLVIRAAKALQQKTGITKGAAFELMKQIPIGAGMGGGSADAAAALIGLNHLWKTGLNPSQLMALGAEIGADIPFMLAGGFARVQGMGEKIEPLPGLAPASLVVIQPCQGLSTPQVFSEYDRMPALRHPDTAAALTALQAGNDMLLEVAAGNVLQPAAEKMRPQISEALAALQACSASFTTMTGSGSAVFGVFRDHLKAQAAWKTLKKRWHKCWLTGTCLQGIEMH